MNKNMKMKAVLSVIAVVAFVVGAISYRGISQSDAGKKVLYYTCSMHPTVKADKPGSCPICEMALEPVYAPASTTNNVPNTTTNATSTDAKPTPYPLDTCVVDGMKLGSMGAPYVFTYQGQEVKFCCAGCKPEFDKNSDKYMKIIRDAEAKK